MRLAGRGEYRRRVEYIVPMRPAAPCYMVSLLAAVFRELKRTAAHLLVLIGLAVCTRLRPIPTLP